MHCGHCKKHINPEAAYCKHCGTIFEKERIPVHAVDLKLHFLHPRYLRFLFFSLKGRLNRERYWSAHYFLMICFLVYFVVSIVIGAYWGHYTQSNSRGFAAFWIAILAGFIVAYLLTIPLKIKRSHDLNHSKWFYFIWLIPGIALLTSFWLAFRSGTQGANAHGHCPRGKHRHHQREEAP